MPTASADRSATAASLIIALIGTKGFSLDGDSLEKNARGLGKASKVLY